MILRCENGDNIFDKLHNKTCFKESSDREFVEFLSVLAERELEDKVFGKDIVSAISVEIDRRFEIKKAPLNLNVMINEAGSKNSFRCDCGANVFTKASETKTEVKYECHGCGTRWTGTK